ncbi:MAG TPA: hypothetical protein PKX66_08445, partial [Rectinema sp.]|nr:hypothetical protein [Rectinema sp.]
MRSLILKCLRCVIVRMQVIWRYSLQKVPASCFASLGLWIGLGLHGIGLESLKIGPYSRIDSGSLQLVLALVLNAVALTWLEFIGIRGKCIGARQSFEIVSAISTRNIKSKFLLWSALSMGLALSAGVLRFQDQETSFIVPAEPATAASAVAS